MNKEFKITIDYQKIGKRIRDIREDKDISQKKLAEMMGIDNTKLSRIEGGSQPIQLDEFFKVVEILKVKPNYLLEQDIVVGDEAYIANRVEKFFEVRTTSDKSLLGANGAYSYEDLCCSISGDNILITGKKYLFTFIRNIAEANKLKSQSEDVYAGQVEEAWRQFCKNRKECKKSKQSKQEKYFLIPATQLAAIIQEEADLEKKRKDAIEEVLGLESDEEKI